MSEMTRAKETAALFFDSCGGETVSLSSGHIILPGFCDVHVHFREPGFSYKETMETGSRAAAHGGYTDVCTMPNLNPVPDTKEHLEEQLCLIRENACIRVHPLGAITLGEKGEQLTDMESLAANAIAFSDDGRGVQSDDMMRSAMQEAKRLDKIYFIKNRYAKSSEILLRFFDLAPFCHSVWRVGIAAEYCFCADFRDFLPEKRPWIASSLAHSEKIIFKRNVEKSSLRYKPTHFGYIKPIVISPVIYHIGVRNVGYHARPHCKYARINVRANPILIIRGSRRMRYAVNYFLANKMLT